MGTIAADEGKGWGGGSGVGTIPMEGGSSVGTIPMDEGKGGGGGSGVGPGCEGCGGGRRGRTVP